MTKRLANRFKLHPACKLMPSMNAEAFQALKSDIEANGLLEPIWILDGKIIDGRHRYKACLELGIVPLSREYAGPLKPEAFVLAQNLARRHLTRKERQWFVKRMLQLHPEQPAPAIAAMTGSSPSTVAKMRRSVVQFAQQARVTGRDGRSYAAVKPRPVTHRAASLITPIDFECKKALKFISELHPSEITDAVDFISQLENQLARLKEMLTIAKAG